MAFRGRGEIPSIGDNQGINSNNNGEGMPQSHYHYGLYYRTYYYVPLDNTYVIMQMIVTFIILIVGIITYLTTYESTVVDQIENIKARFINIYSITLLILVSSTLIVSFFSKTKESLEKKLIVILIISIISMMILGTIKLNLDSTYTKEKFEEIYSALNIDENISNDKKIYVGIDGLGIKTEKEYYIDECVKVYNIFKIKTNVLFGIHLALNILIIYRLFMELKNREQREKVLKDDIVLFDEEQNVKY